MTKETLWLYRNKATGITYGPITAQQKAEQEQHPMTRGRYTYERFYGERPQPPAEEEIPEPVEAKKAEEPTGEDSRPRRKRRKSRPKPDDK